MFLVVIQVWQTTIKRRMSNELQRVRVKNKAYKPLPVLRVYISKDNGKMRLLLSTFYKRYKVKHFVQII